jgi:hypothetical protein
MHERSETGVVVGVTGSTPVPGGMRNIYIHAPRAGQLILTPFGPIRSNPNGELLPQAVIDYLLGPPEAPTKNVLEEVEYVDGLSGQPILTFAPPVDPSIHDVGSARPFGYTGAQQQMADAKAATDANTVMTMIPPLPTEVIQMAKDSFDQPPPGALPPSSTGRRGRS